MLGGNLIVQGATEVAEKLQLNRFLVGATLVAMGTTAPELATMIVAHLRGHNSLGLGTIIGSNIFNGAFVVAIAAMIHPVSVTRITVLPALVCGFVSLLLIYPGAGGFIGKQRGVYLLGLYCLYLATQVSIQLSLN